MDSFTVRTYCTKIPLGSFPLKWCILVHIEIHFMFYLSVPSQMFVSVPLRSSPQPPCSWLWLQEELGDLDILCKLKFFLVPLPPKKVPGYSGNHHILCACFVSGTVYSYITCNSQLLSRIASLQWWRLCLPMQETQETRVRSPIQEDPLEEAMATHSSILAWEIPWTKEPGRPRSMRL